MKRILVLVLGLVVLFAVPNYSHALFFINFENGTDGQPVNNIPGISFQSFNGFTSLYGDSRTGNYNTHSDDLNYGSGGYHHNGNFFLWAGTNASAQGVKVDFTNNDGTFFKTGYAVNLTTFLLTAHLTDGSDVTVSGGVNYGSPMGYLQVNASPGTFIDYVVLHDTGNYWLVDDMSGDTTGIPGVPEPATLLLLGSGLLGLVGFRRKFRK